MIVVRDHANRTLRFNQSIYIKRFLRYYEMWEFKSQFTFIKIIIRLLFVQKGYVTLIDLR